MFLRPARRHAHQIRLHLLDHLAVIGKSLAHSDSLFCFLKSFGISIGYTDDFDVRKIGEGSVQSVSKIPPPGVSNYDSAKTRIINPERGFQRFPDNKNSRSQQKLPP